MGVGLVSVSLEQLDAFLAKSRSEPVLQARPAGWLTTGSAPIARVSPAWV